jgi:outer membrane protein assembly factor BamB
MVGAVVVTTVRAGRDVGLDATTAAEAPVPDVPKALGDKRFSVDIQGTTVRAGGVGFIVGAPGGVRAYDSSGQERWHYTRRGRSAFTSDGPFVFDDGRTVLVAFESAVVDGTSLAGHVVALDAITGSVLWTSYDPEIMKALEGEFFDPRTANSYLMRRDADRRWTRIDTRTGEPTWSIDSPKECPRRAAGAGDHIALVSQCVENDQVVYRLETVGAVTGKTLVDKVINTFRIPDGIDREIFMRDTDIHLVALGGGAIAVGDYSVWAPENASAWRAMNTTTGTDVILPGQPLASTGPADGSVLTQVSTYPRDVVDLRDGPRLEVRCQLGARLAYDERAVWLGSQVVFDTEDVLTAFSRTDCAPTAVTREPGEIIGVYAAPGALLVARKDGRRVLVDGYS